MRQTTKLLYIFIILMLAGMVLMSSCGQNGTDAAAQDSGASAKDAQGEDSSRPGGDFAQNRADLFGEVKSVSGNQVTIALFEMPQRQEMTEEERQKMREEREKNRQNGDQSQGDRLRGGGPGQGGGRFMGERKYTGQTEILTIPDNAPITTFARGNGKPEEKKLSLSDIKTGSIIQIWYKKDIREKKEIQNIRVMQAPQQ